MKQKRIGFTLIEVALFLAVTGVLFMAIVVGTGRSVAEQRFFDSTQNFAEFLRSVYSQVSNPQSIGNGRGDLAIYGKMISFGQDTDLSGDKLDDGQRIFVYDVVGKVKADVTGSGSADKLLKGVDANVVVFRGTGDVILPNDAENSLIKSVGFAGIVEEYEPKWGASIETTAEKPTVAVSTTNNNLYTGTILIVRHPTSGTINTLVLDKQIIQVNQDVWQAKTSENYSGLKDLLTQFLQEDSTNKFVTQEIDFCINPEGENVASDRRWNVRLIQNARNASGVEIIELDDLEDGEDGTKNKCQK